MIDCAYYELINVRGLVYAAPFDNHHEQVIINIKVSGMVISI